MLSLLLHILYNTVNLYGHMLGAAMSFIISSAQTNLQPIFVSLNMQMWQNGQCWEKVVHICWLLKLMDLWEWIHGEHAEQSRLPVPCGDALYRSVHDPSDTLQHRFIDNT